MRYIIKLFPDFDTTPRYLHICKSCLTNFGGMWDTEVEGATPLARSQAERFIETNKLQRQATIIEVWGK